MSKGIVVTDKDLGLKRLIAEVKQYNDIGVTAGVMEGKRNSEGLNIAQYGAMNEFGTSDIPERSFMRSTFDENEIHYFFIFHDGIKRLGQNVSLSRLLSYAGMRMQNDIQETIKSGVDPANSPYTIKQKGSDKTLIDTGALIQSITYEITKK